MLIRSHDYTLKRNAGSSQNLISANTLQHPDLHSYMYYALTLKCEVRLSENYIPATTLKLHPMPIQSLQPYTQALDQNPWRITLPHIHWQFRLMLIRSLQSYAQAWSQAARQRHTLLIWLRGSYADTVNMGIHLRERHKAKKTLKTSAIDTLTTMA